MKEVFLAGEAYPTAEFQLRDEVQETVDYMLIEANPWELALDEDLSRADLEELAGKPAHLLNRAWHLFREHPEGYREWEKRAIRAFLAE